MHYHKSRLSDTVFMSLHDHCERSHLVNTTPSHKMFLLLLQEGFHVSLSNLEKRNALCNDKGYRG